MPRAEPTAHPLVAWPFLEAARELGLPVEAGETLLGWSGVAPGQRPRFAHEVANQLLSWSVELSGREDFGLLAAEHVEPGHFDLVELATRAQQTVGEALDTLTALLPILHQGLAIDLSRGESVSRLSLRLSPGLSLHPAAYDFIAGALVVAGRRQTGLANVGLSRVHLPHPPHADRAPLERVLATELCFDAPALALEFPTEALSLPLLRSSPAVAGVLRQAAEGLLAPLRGPTETRARALIAERLAGEGTGLGPIARAMHMSDRTLRRRLQDEGVSFRELVDDVRRERALSLLEDAALSTEQIATALGFTTAQAFHRAFRRWTGSTVQAYRARGGAA